MSWLAARDLGHSDEPHAPSLGSSFGASPSLNSRRAKKKADHGILPIFCWQTVAFCFLCGRLLGLSLANLRKEKYIANSPEPRFEDSS